MEPETAKTTPATVWRGRGKNGALQQAQLSPPNSWPLRSFSASVCSLYLSLLTRPWWRGGRTRCGRGRRTGEGGSGRSLREPEDRRFRRNGRNEYVMAANFSKCGVYNPNGNASSPLLVAWNVVECVVMICPSGDRVRLGKERKTLLYDPFLAVFIHVFLRPTLFPLSLSPPLRRRRTRRTRRRGPTARTGMDRRDQFRNRGCKRGRWESCFLGSPYPTSMVRSPFTPASASSWKGRPWSGITCLAGGNNLGSSVTFC